jgi:uncharacterized membrane protein YgcG
MKNLFNYFLVFLFLLFHTTGFAQDIPAATGQVVSDFSEILTLEQEEVLAKKIQTVYKETGNQLFVLTVPSDYYANSTIEDFAQKLFDKWQPGQAGADNGLLLIVGGSRTDSLNRALRIHTGYAIETMLTDIESSRIEKDVMVPELKQYNYYEAILKGTEEILKKIAMYKVMIVSPSNKQVFAETDVLQDNAHCFTDRELTDLKIRNTNFLGMHTCKITTAYDKFISPGVSDSYLYDKDMFNLEIAVSPWVLVPIKDSMLAMQIGKRVCDIKINSQFAQKEEISPIYYKSGCYKAAVAYLDKVAKDQKECLFVFLASLMLPLLVWLASRRVSSLQQKDKYTKSKMKGKYVGLKICVWLLYIFSCLNVISLTFFQTGISFLYFTSASYDFVNLSFGWAIPLGIVNFIAYAIAFYKASDFIEVAMGIKISSGGGGSTYSGSTGSYSSSSSSSSSSSYSSSSSSYSSSSNSGYYGGGGRSGGGGASSGW